MMQNDQDQAKKVENANRVADKARGLDNASIVVVCLFMVAGMGGLAYASVPLYKLFCQVTGYGGTTQRAESGTVKAVDKDITVRFDSNITSDLAWDFKPVKRQVIIKLGEEKIIEYEARNLGSTPLTGTASFNVTPQAAGQYFNKIECFCFTEQTLKPGEHIKMPVQFFVDPEILTDEAIGDVKTITLSYTFFAVDEPQESAKLKSGTATGNKPDQTTPATVVVKNKSKL